MRGCPYASRNLKKDVPTTHDWKTLDSREHTGAGKLAHHQLRRQAESQGLALE